MLLREGLVRLFDEAGYQTVAALPDATDVVDVVNDTAPDLVITDVRLPPTFRDEGIRAALALRKRFPAVAILVLSQYVETVYAAELVEAAGGGVGYLLKDRLTSLMSSNALSSRSARAAPCSILTWFVACFLPAATLLLP